MPGATIDHVLSGSISELLERFDGDETLKELFWSYLSFNKATGEINLARISRANLDGISEVSLFAERGNAKILKAAIPGQFNRNQVERMCVRLRDRMPDVLVLFELGGSHTWVLVYPDPSNKHVLRILELPGEEHQRTFTANALAALAPADEADESWLKTAERLETYFPGPMPRSNLSYGDLEIHFKYSAPQLQEVRWYAEQMARYPLLTETQEKGDDLSGKERCPDGSSLDYSTWRLVVHNLRWGAYWASRSRKWGMELEDLIQQASLGLIRAAQKFDRRRGIRFTTYATYWIRQSIGRGLLESYSLFHWPVYKAAELVPANLSGDDEVMASLKLGERREQQLTASDYESELLTDPDQDPEYLVYRFELRELIEKVIADFDKREREILFSRFGIDREQKTLEELGKQFRVTRERIRQIEHKLLKIAGKRLSIMLGKPLPPIPITEAEEDAEEEVA